MEKGIIFCSFSEAVREHPDLVQKYLGSVVSYRDNFFAALNSAVFSDVILSRTTLLLCVCLAVVFAATCPFSAVV